MVFLNRTLSFVALALLPALGSKAQGTYAERARAYIATYKNLAMDEQRRTGVPAAITLAQGIYETSAGASELATEANNHFGIKCKREWTGETFAHTDDAPNECFRKYASAEDSYRDHSDYLRSNARYAACFRQKPADYVAWATELKRAGYATNPRYAQLVAKVVEDFGLQDYTYAALQPVSETVALFTPEVVPVQDVPVATTPPPVANAAPAPSPRSTYMEYRNGLQGFYAQAGEMLLTAATRYNVRYAKLLEWNDLHDAPLPFDGFIYLEKKPTRASKPTHVVLDGETALQVAQREGIQLASLRALNQLEDGEEPVTGTTLYLQGGAPIKPRTYRPQPAKPAVVETAAPVAAAPTSDYVATVPSSPTPAGNAEASTPVPTAAAPTSTDPAIASTVPSNTPASGSAPSGTATDDPEAAPAASNDPLARLKARLDKAVYTPAKAEPAPAKTKAGKEQLAATEAAPVAPKTTVAAALPKPRKDSARAKAPVVIPAASAPRTVSAALPKDMQPTTPAISTASAAPAGNVEFHTVARGETVFSIAKRYSVSVSDLQTWNKMDFAAIRVGQQLRVKKP